MALLGIIIFHPTGPTIFNLLPANLQKAMMLDSFKRQLDRLFLDHPRPITIFWVQKLSWSGWPVATTLLMWSRQWLRRMMTWASRSQTIFGLFLILILQVYFSKMFSGSTDPYLSWTNQTRVFDDCERTEHLILTKFFANEISVEWEHWMWLWQWLWRMMTWASRSKTKDASWTSY